MDPSNENPLFPALHCWDTNDFIFFVSHLVYLFTCIYTSFTLIFKTLSSFCPLFLGYVCVILGLLSFMGYPRCSDQGTTNFFSDHAFKYYNNINKLSVIQFNCSFRKILLFDRNQERKFVKVISFSVKTSQ